ncbi:MAG: ABC transporter substrate-binding protein, partial [Acidimicrobiales bacterium]|nr:ABC transporter substrate-binding protein [Acidimicrobiales bacterium]
MALIAGACTDDAVDATAATSTTILRPSTVLRVGAEDWPRCLNPLTCADDVLREQVLQHVLPVTFEVDAGGDYVVSSLLAAPPEPAVTDAGVEIRYQIAPEARWADARPVTSSDFLGTWRAIMDTPGADRARYERIVTVDDSDPALAVVTLDGPMIDWQELFGGATGFVLEADAFGPSTDLTGQFEDELPMAAGPYVLSSWDGNGAVLSATEPWDGADGARIDQVRLDRVEIGGLGDPMAFDVLLPGDGVMSTAPDGFDTRFTDSTTVLGIWFDQRQPTLAPLVHRQALEVVLDRSALAKRAGAADPPACVGWVPAVGPWCAVAGVEPVETNQQLGAFVLFEAGWTAGEDGILAGPSGRFEVPVAFDATTPGAEAVASAVVESFRAIGADASSSPRSTDEWLSGRAPDDSTGVGVFAADLGISPRVADLYGCPDGVDSSVVGACPESVVTLARRLGSLDGAEALNLVERLGDAVAAEVLWLPLAVIPDRSFVRPGRVTTLDTGAVAGGPLAGLDRFE